MSFHNIIAPIYFTSSILVVVFVLVAYIFKIEIWPTPDNPRRIILFNVLGNGWLLANLVMAIYTSVVSPMPLFFTSPAWSIVAALLIMVAFLIASWAFKIFRAMRKIFGMEINRLITEGPYKYMRHPQYFSILLWTLALMMLFNTFQAFIYAVATSLAFYVAGFMEERKLEEIFGDQYRRYKERTPAIPFIRLKPKK